MRSAQISFKNKKVVIVGGGKQAYKRVQQFLSEEAKVQVITSTLYADISEEIVCIKQYEKQDLKDAFLVFACTDDKELNKKIVEDANSLNVLSASVHKDMNATYHPLQSKDYENMHLALSTNGAYPAYIPKMMQDMEEVYKDKYQQVLSDLRILREFILSLNLSQEERTSLLREIAMLDAKQIHFYKEATQKQKALILVFHGNDEKESIAIIEEVIKELDIPSFYAFIKENAEVSLEEVKKHLELLQIKKVIYQPMFLEEGYCYKKMEKIIHKHEPLLFNEKNIKRLSKAYDDAKQHLIVVHDSKERKFINKLKQYMPLNVNVISLDENTPFLYKDKQVELSGMFVLPGKHLLVDVLSEEGIYGKLKQDGYIVNCSNCCLLHLPVFRKILTDKYNVEDKM